jgi:hypothetical protein
MIGTKLSEELDIELFASIEFESLWFHLLSDKEGLQVLSKATFVTTIMQVQTKEAAHVLNSYVDVSGNG